MVDITQNALKFAFIASKYPEHKLIDILKLLSLAPVDHNLCLWEGRDKGWFDVSEDGIITLGENLPEFTLEGFGEHTKLVADKLLLALAQLGKKEADMEETALYTWFAGYRPHDLFIAVHILSDSKLISIYELENDETDEETGEKQSSAYTFYTLFDNAGKEWGKKQFIDQSRVEKSEKDADPSVPVAANGIPNNSQD